MQYLEDHGLQGVMERMISLAPANKNRPSAELQPKKAIRSHSLMKMRCKEHSRKKRRWLACAITRKFIRKAANAG